jgi:alkyl sulfatase BDS1-like metallo-beta-lactamase superfamily hydrolase
MTPHLIALLLASAAAAPPTSPPASPQVKADNAALAATLDWADEQDFDFASRGYLGTIADGKIRDAAGNVLAVHSGRPALSRDHPSPPLPFLPPPSPPA